MEFLILIPFLIAYLIGSIPFGVILGKLAGIGDIRNVGSGNIGATNMLRAGGKKLAIATLLLDALKGAIICLALHVLGVGEIPESNTLLADQPDHNFPYYAISTAYPWLGLFIIIGHCFPVWLKFRGGKGVATMMGLYISMFFLPYPIPLYIAIAPIISWLLVFFIFRYSSLSGLFAAWAGACAMAMFALPYFVPMALIALLITFKHRDNIRRLMKGEEPKVSFSKKKVAE